ncbi:hypothetical protein M885DRAFT_126048 [Pelagophyceae sp. CCMP2097]|nr:hypothetical protein M885DRAFT_126048 [Pelagophyceae sp. CCMP2097]
MAGRAKRTHMEEESHYGLGLRHLEGSAVARALGDRERAPLGRLTLFGCGLSSLRGLPTYGSRCEALRVLVLSSNELGGAFDAALYPALGELEQLETLDVSSNRLRDLEPPRNARPLLRLRSFTVVYNQLASLRGLADWAPNLETLDARANTLSDVRGASALRRLRRLSLRGAATDDGNPLCAHKRYRQRVVEEAPSVVELDGEALEDALRASVLPLPRKRADEEDIADEVEERPPQRRRDGRQQTRATDNNEARRVDALEAELEALRVELAEVTEGRDEEAAEERSRLESERDVALSVASAAHAACRDLRRR